MTLDIREIDAAWDEQWDALAGETETSGFMQSSAWAAFKRCEGYETPRFGLFEDGALVGGASMLVYPHETEGLVLCPEGPVLPWHRPETAREGLRLLISAAQELPAARRGVGFRIEPHLPPPAPSLLRNWSRGPIDLTPVHTLMVELTCSGEEILARMRPKGRYNLKLAQKHGVVTVQSQEMRDLSTFYELFEETAWRNDFFAEPFGFFLNLGATLFPARRAALFLADYDGETIAAVMVVFFGRRATYLYGGSSPRHRNVMPNYALHWAAIMEARKRGCREYDLYGYDPFGVPDHLYAGISRFKRQLGGERRDWIGARDLIFYDRLAEQVADRLTLTHSERRT